MQVSYLIYVVLLKCNHFFHVAYNLDSLYYRFHNYRRQENPQLPYVRSLVSWPLHSANSRLSQLDFPFMSRWGPGPSVRGKEGSPESLPTVAPDSVSAVSEGGTSFSTLMGCVGKGLVDTPMLITGHFLLVHRAGVSCGPCSLARGQGSFLLSWRSHSRSPAPSLVSHRHHWPTFPEWNLPLPF